MTESKKEKDKIGKDDETNQERTDKLCMIVVQVGGCV